jgi:hypothetical protein
MYEVIVPEFFCDVSCESFEDFFFFGSGVELFFNGRTSTIISSPTLMFDAFSIKFKSAMERSFAGFP